MTFRVRFEQGHVRVPEEVDGLFWIADDEEFPPLRRKFPQDRGDDGDLGAESVSWNSSTRMNSNLLRKCASTISSRSRKRRWV